jgi:hypothetical protein
MFSFFNDPVLQPYSHPSKTNRSTSLVVKKNEPSKLYKYNPFVMNF